MGYEIEIKYRLASFEQLEQRLAERGLSCESVSAQEDWYLSHPSRDFAATHEALRLRRVGDENRITYKGPRRDGPTKTREELEIPFAAGERPFLDFKKMLENLGFRTVATIRKVRKTYHWVRDEVELEIVLDDAENLGHFAEIEALARTEDGLAAAQAAVLDAARELGLSEVERRSYLRMQLEAGLQWP
jgi:adenylate cyclase class 2